MAKGQKKTTRETRKQKAGQPAGKKVPRYLRDGAPSPVEIMAPKTPAKKAPGAG